MNFGIAPAVSMLNLAASLAHAENTIIFSLHGHAVVAWPGRQVSFKDCCTGTVACFDTAF